MSADLIKKLIYLQAFRSQVIYSLQAFVILFFKNMSSA